MALALNLAGWEIVKTSVSYKEIILIAGILIAIIASVITWHYIETQAASFIQPGSSPKVNTSQVIRKLGNTILTLSKATKSYSR